MTGGIGSGKSTVCGLFQALGIGIVDADIIARQLVEPGQPALTQMIENFGTKILNADGSLNRARLRELVFADTAKKQRLESILHPLIYARIAAETARLQGNYCIVAVPLLLETGQASTVDRVLVVDCCVEVQITRVISRDKLSRDQALAVIASQMPREQRLAQADDVIDNSGTPLQLAEQVKRLHNSYNLSATARISPA
ncbi:MAG: dephospho-CoA kinase [Methylomonas sp.]